MNDPTLPELQAAIQAARVRCSDLSIAAEVHFGHIVIVRANVAVSGPLDAAQAVEFLEAMVQS